MVTLEDRLLVVDVVVNIVEPHVEEFVRRTQSVGTVKCSDGSTGSLEVVGLDERVVIEVVECDVVPDHSTSCIVRLDTEDTLSQTALIWNVSASTFFIIKARIANVVSLTDNKCSLNDIDARTVDTDGVVCNTSIVNDEIVTATPNTVITALFKVLATRLQPSETYLVGSELDHNGVVRSVLLNKVLKSS